MGASAFLKSVDFRAFAVNVKTIVPKKYLYQFGHAIWWHTAPMAIDTFLESYDLNGKVILPFCTSGGSSIEESMPTIRSLGENGGATVGTGLTANRLNQEIIRTWLEENGIQ